MKFLKYEFADWATAKKAIETTTTSLDGITETTWNTDLVVAVVELGHICTQWETNEQGEQVCVAENPNYAVDILWQNEPLAAYTESVVWPAPCGIHIFAGWEEVYAQEYCVANPDAAYCQPPAPIEE
jgi:hypothetical protein